MYLVSHLHKIKIENAPIFNQKICKLKLKRLLGNLKNNL